MRILIAEDDATSRIMLSGILKKAGHQVVEAEDGLVAWQILQKPDAPRLAILDWMMPGLDGLDLVRRTRLKDADRPTYLIMLTAKAEKDDIVEGLRAGADDYLTKPFDLGELWARVEVGQRMVHLQDRLAQQVQELRQAMDHIKTLQGIIPICGFCKKIRNDQGYWDQVEDYITKHSDAHFSHGVCPECMDEHYSDVMEKKDDGPQGTEDALPDTIAEDASPETMAEKRAPKDDETN